MVGIRRRRAWVDLRENDPAFNVPIKKDPRFNYYNVPFDIDKAQADTKRNGLTFYSNLLSQQDVVRDVFNQISQAEGGVVICCSLGKDRTGVVTFLLLSILGVDMERIINDYCLSAYHLFAGCKNYKKNFKLTKIPTSKRSYFSKFLKEVNNLYGDVCQYIKECNLPIESILKKFKK